jgi:hypothetical protein
MRNDAIIVAEFEGPAELLAAAEKVRDAGYGKFDCHSPFPIHGMDTAMGIKRSKLGFIVGAFALFGLGGAILLQWWAGAVAYPLVISGKPFFSYQAYLPVTFALAVIMAAFASLIGMLALNKLPRWNHPLFESRIFDKIGDNGFFISIESSDIKFSREDTPDLLKSAGAVEIETVGGK